MGSISKLTMSMLLVFAVSAGTAFAQQFPGTIFITDKTGDATKERFTFPNAGDVYLSGGPESRKSPGLTNGTYYFQVTNPTGNKLLSTDDARCRQVVVTGGKITGVPATESCSHALGSGDSSSKPVQLAPFLPTTDDDGEYRVWFIRKATSTTISTSDSKIIKFSQANAKTDSFKVKVMPVPPVGSCQPASALSVMSRGKSVVSYVARGSWSPAQQVPGVAAVEIEGNAFRGKTSELIDTKPVNSCASNSITGETVCTTTMFDKEVYVISSSNKVKSIVSSDASGMPFFSAQSFCMTCLVTMDPIHNKAVIGLALQDKDPLTFAPTGFQLLDLGRRKPKFEPAFLSRTPETQFTTGKSQISEGFLSDPLRNLILSPNEHSTYEIVKLLTWSDFLRGFDHDKDKNWNNNDNDGDNHGGHDWDDLWDEWMDKFRKSYPVFFEKVFQPEFSVFASAAEDCTTGIALASRLNDPTKPQEVESQIFIADLTQAIPTAAPVSPSPTASAAMPSENSNAFGWDAPSQIQKLDESILFSPNSFRRGANGIAVAQGTHLGVVTPDGGGNQITAIMLPKTSGAGTPRITDWVTCTIPAGFTMGFDPRPVTAYQSPITDDGMAILGNIGNTELAVVNLTKMMNVERLAKTGPGSHTCARPLTTTTSTADKSAVVRFIAVP